MGFIINTLLIFISISINSCMIILALLSINRFYYKGKIITPFDAAGSGGYTNSTKDKYRY